MKSRTAMCNALEEMGLVVEVHHHEVATAGQNEIGVKFNTLVAKADEVQTLKYCVRNNVADAYGKTVTFMPKPLCSDNGSACRAHVDLQDGKNTFAGEGYAGLSETALYFIGGIIKHGKARTASPTLDQLLQAPGPGARSSGDAGLLGAQPFRLDPYPYVSSPEGAQALSKRASRTRAANPLPGLQPRC